MSVTPWLTEVRDAAFKTLVGLVGLVGVQMIWCARTGLTSAAW